MAIYAPLGGDGSLLIGENKTLDLEILIPTVVAGVLTLLPPNATGWGIVFTARREPEDTAYVFEVTATIVGVYNAVRATNTQRARAALTPVHTNLLTVLPHLYSWKRIDSGLQTVLLYGPLYPERPATR